MNKTRDHLNRPVFTTSRLAEFCSEKELVAQIGHTSWEWPLVVAKELPDNALDEAERTGTPPRIAIAVTAQNQIIVADNGAGIPPSVIEKLINYDSRSSSKEAFVSPTRGQQGNALKTILAMPFAIDGETGNTIIESYGARHSIEFGIDPIRRSPVIRHDIGTSAVKNGTRITVQWPDRASYQLMGSRQQFLHLGQNFAILNPHAHVAVSWCGQETNYLPTDLDWKKWTASDPTSPHWYNTERFERLIAAYIAHELDNGGSITVRDFISSFRGLSGTSKQKVLLENIGAARTTLSDFFDNGDNTGALAALLAGMKQLSKPIHPSDLGVIGRNHLFASFEQLGVELASFRYQKLHGTTAAGLPWVAEIAFGWTPNSQSRRLICGLNFSPSISNPFTNLGDHTSLDSVLTDQRASANEPIALLVHLTCPALQFSNRGKSALDLTGEIGDALSAATVKVTADWSKQRKAEERQASRAAFRRDRLTKSSKISTKDAAYEIMEEAWLKASSGGTLPATARQVMYAARPYIQDRTGNKLRDSYFTQNLLPDYIAEHDLDWDVVFDSRGHFHEPILPPIGIGTLEIRRYLNGLRGPVLVDASLTQPKIQLSGPEGNFGGILFIEKEGFFPLLERVQLGRRFDLAIMSTKGMPTTAARRLVEALCSGSKAVPLFVLHDFDKSGFSIAATLQRTNRRYEFQNEIRFIDLGLRLTDVESLNLYSSAEDVFDKGEDDKKRHNLSANGATAAEIEFLLHKRIELNALTAEQLVQLIEDKLIANGVQKLVPENDLLSLAFKSQIRSKTLHEIVLDAQLTLPTIDESVVPADLRDRVGEMVSQRPTLHWYDAVRMIAREH